MLHSEHWQVVGLYFGHRILQTEASLMKVKTCINL